MAINPPTAKQLRLLRRLATEKGQSYAEPTTVTEASDQIERLLALQSDGYGQRGRMSRGGSSRTRAVNRG